MFLAVLALLVSLAALPVLAAHVHLGVDVTDHAQADDGDDSDSDDSDSDDSDSDDSDDGGGVDPACPPNCPEAA